MINEKCYIGVNPGIANTGVAVVSWSLSRYQLLASELVKSTPKTPKAERLLGIYEAVHALLGTHECALVSIEKCYHNKNVSSSQSTSSVIGAVMCAAAAKGVPVVEVTPQQVKASTGLGGRCDKKKVGKMMSRLLCYKKINHHIADAAVCAIAGCLKAKKMPSR